MTDANSKKQDAKTEGKPDAVELPEVPYAPSLLEKGLAYLPITSISVICQSTSFLVQRATVWPFCQEKLNDVLIKDVIPDRLLRMGVR